MEKVHAIFSSYGTRAPAELNCNHENDDVCRLDLSFHNKAEIKIQWE